MVGAARLSGGTGEAEPLALLSPVQGDEILEQRGPGVLPTRMSVVRWPCEQGLAVPQGGGTLSLAEASGEDSTRPYQGP